MVQARWQCQPGTLPLSYHVVHGMGPMLTRHLVASGDTKEGDQMAGVESPQSCSFPAHFSVIFDAVPTTSSLPFCPLPPSHSLSIRTAVFHVTDHQGQKLNDLKLMKYIQQVMPAPSNACPK